MRGRRPLASNRPASSVSSAVRRHAFRGISGPRAHPLEEFMMRSPMGIQALGGALCAIPRSTGRRSTFCPRRDRAGEP